MGCTVAARYDGGSDDGSGRELGWDRRLAAYARQYRHDQADDGDQVTEWSGPWIAGHLSVGLLVEAHGWTVPGALPTESDAERAV